MACLELQLKGSESVMVVTKRKEAKEAEARGAKSDSKEMKTTGEGGVGRKERLATVQLWERIKQSLLCQQLNTPRRTCSIAEVLSQHKNKTSADVKIQLVSYLYLSVHK